MATRASRILRLGVVIDGKIVQERLIRAGDPVTIGPAPSSTFIYTDTGSVGASWPLFVPVAGRYELHFSDDMRGKISSGGSVIRLDQLRADPEVRRGGRYVLPLTDHDRGKLVLGDVTMLFQFVEPPPVNAAIPLRSMDFRPRLLEEDDPVFLGFLAINAALASVLLVFIWNTEVPETTSLDEIPGRISRFILPPDDIVVEPEPELESPDEVPEPEVADAAPPEPEKPPEVAPEPRPTPKDPKVADAMRQQEMREQLKERYAALIGTNGDSGSKLFGELVKMVPDDEPAAWDRSDGEVGVVGTKGPTNEGGPGWGDVVIDEPGPLCSGDCDGTITDGPTQEYIPTTEPPTIDDSLPTSDREAIKRVIDANFNQLAACYEKYLNEDQSLAGRIELDWTVRQGRAQDVWVADNGTGNRGFGDCVAGRVSTWRFPHGIDAEIGQSWVFRQK